VGAEFGRVSLTKGERKFEPDNWLPERDIARNGKGLARSVPVNY
jgi:hypothetical protein